MSGIQLPEHIFRAYDIRGIVGQGLNRDIMALIGRAVASEALEQGETALILAADARLSSPGFAEAMTQGILASGCDVISIGTVPTPMLYFATHTLETGSGVMITGSHNPKDYNGVKIVLRNRRLSAEKIRALKDRIENGNLRDGVGEFRSLDISAGYIDRICRDIRLARAMKIVIDCGNGVASNCAPPLFNALGCRVVPMFCEADGNFPNHHPDPTRIENLAGLIERVKDEEADLGIAFDGDGDRVGLISNEGGVIDADKMMLAFTADILPDNPGGKVVFDVKSSRLLPGLVHSLHGEAIMCKSGHSFVNNKMQETGALLGGEYSAHIFFSHRWYGFDDGLYTAARFLELMDRNRCSSAALVNRYPPMFSTPELHLPVREEDKFTIMQTLQQNLLIPGASINRLDGVRADTEHGWGLVRASNTTPSLVLRFEADSAAALAALKTQFREAIAALIPGLAADF